MPVKKLRLGVLVSGGGTNLQAIIDACEAGKIPAEVAVVISNNSDAYGLERARKHNIPAVHLSNKQHPKDDALDLALAAKLKEYKVDLVCFAGYMKKRGPLFLKEFPNRVLNIHPGPLPRFGGDGMHGHHVHEAVLKAGIKSSGPTVHIVDDRYDHGPILGHIEVPVLPGDTPDTLAERVLVQEHVIYADIIGKIARGEMDLDSICGQVKYKVGGEKERTRGQEKLTRECKKK
jgi:phosphoribosylglycinamide formyltransferase-1